MVEPPGARTVAARLFFISGALLLAALTAPRWLPVEHTTLIALAAARWLVGIAAAVVLLLSLLSRDRISIAVCAVVAAGHLAIAAPSFIGSGRQAGDDSITVMAINVEYGWGDLHQLRRDADELDVDILVITEAVDLDAGLVSSGLADRFPHRQGRDTGGGVGTMVLSRWPSELVDDGRSTLFDQPLVRVATPDGPLLVRGVHSASPPFAQWRSELEAMAATPAGETPMVLAGDFNASGDHQVFRKITARFPDAHDQVGAGWVRTWNAKSWPFVHIDHVLLHGLRALDAGVVDVPGSDHRAVWAKVEREP